MKLLIYCPLAPKTPRIYARTLTSIFTLNYNEYVDLVFGKNDIIETSINSNTPKYNDLKNKHNHARQLVLDNNYDAVLFLENDMVLPQDAITKLLNVDADVAYGLYISRHGWRRWLAFSSIGDVAGRSFSADIDMAKSLWGQTVVTKGVGMGCTLIHKHVLEKIEFRNHEEDLVADDWMFSLDCELHGFVQKHDLSLLCGHITPLGEILWPTIENDTLHETEFMNHSEQIIISKDKPLELNVGKNGIAVNEVR